MRKCTAARLWLCGSIPLLLAACGGSGPADENNPYAGGRSYPWSYTAPAGKLTTLSLTPGENNLYYEPILAARNSWGPIEIDRSNGEQLAGDGRTLTLNGVPYARGFGVHADSELRYSLKGTDGAQCTRFTADIGVDDEVGRRGSVVFQVYLDGAKVYDSGTMTGASATKHVDVEITGKQELRLVVNGAGDNIDYDHADWAIPRVYCAAAQPQLELTLASGTFNIAHTETKALKATFTSNSDLFSGPVNLRLESLVEETRAQIDLQTTVIDLPGRGTYTRDLVLFAPSFTYQASSNDFTGPFRLTASVNGQDVASADVTITEDPLGVRLSLEPNPVSAKPGETATLTLVVNGNGKAITPFKLDLSGQLCDYPAPSTPCPASFPSDPVTVTTFPARIPLQVKFRDFDAGTETRGIHTVARLEGDQYDTYNRYSTIPTGGLFVITGWTPLPK